MPRFAQLQASSSVQEQGQNIAQMVSSSAEGLVQAAQAAAAIAVDPAVFRKEGAPGGAGGRPFLVDHEKAAQFCTQFFG